MKEWFRRTIAFICAICIIVTGEMQPALVVLADIINDLPTVLTESILTKEWDIYRIKVTYDEEAGIPDDAELVVYELTADNNPNYSDYLAASADKVGAAEEDINLIKAFDISLCSKTTGEKYQPLKDLKVEISIPFYSLNDDMPVEVVHFDETSIVDAGESSSEPGMSLSDGSDTLDSDVWDEEPKSDRPEYEGEGTDDQYVMDEAYGAEGINSGEEPDGAPEIDYSVIGTPTLMDTELKGSTASFNTGGFSVYVIVQSIVKKVLENGDEANYLVKVEYDTASGIPENAVLEVAELDGESAEYEEYLRKAADTLGKEINHFAFAHAFDITLVNPETGERYQPNKDVKVSIDLLSEDVRFGDSVDVVHFPGSYVGNPSKGTVNEDGGTAEVLEADVSNGTVAFESGSFSVYIVTSDALMQHFVFLNDTDGGLNDSNRGDYVYSEQVLINGESLQEAPKPSKNGAVFSHWSAVVGGDNSFDDDPAVDDDDTVGLSYSTVTINKSEIRTATAAKLGIADESQVTHDQMQAYMNDERTVYFYAVYGAEKVLVKFYNQSGLVLQEVELYKDPATAPAGALSGSLDTNDERYSYIPIQDKENTYIRFEYWTENSDTNINAGTITVSPTDTRTQIELFPVLTDGHYIYFDANRQKTNVSTSYISPIYTVSRIWNESDYTAGLSQEEIEALTDEEILLRKAEILAKELAAELWAKDDHGIPIASGYIFEGWYLLSSGEGTPLFKINASNDGYDYNASELAKRLDSSGNFPNHPTVFAKWAKIDSAGYKVVVWKQMLNNAGTAAVDDYAFVESFNMPMHSVDLNDPVELPDDFKKLNEINSYNAVDVYRETSHTITDNTRENPLYGFEIYLDNDPNARYRTELSETVSPDGSTVLNVYYKRIVYTLTFTEKIYGSGYQVATTTTGTLYGAVNGQMVVLTTVYERRTTATNTYRFTPTTANSGTQYGIYGGNFVQLNYYNYNGKWYRSTTHTDANIYSGTRYIATSGDNSVYTGTRYTTPECNTVTTSNSGTQYWTDGTVIYQLAVNTANTPVYYYNGAEYNGTVFTYKSSSTFDMVVRVIDAPYGVSVLNYFPITNQFTGKKYGNYTWDPVPKNTFVALLSTIETMPAENVVFYGNSGGDSFTVKYYLEYGDDEEAAEISDRFFSGSNRTDLKRTFTYNGVTKNYALYKEIKHEYNFITFGEEYHEIDGYVTDRRYAVPYFGQAGKYTKTSGTFQNNNYAPVGGYTNDGTTTESKVNYLFYQKNSYTLRFVDTSGVTGIMAPAMPQSKTVQYFDNMDGYKPTSTPTLRGHRFTGWYMDPTCTKQVFFTEADYNGAVDADGNVIPADRKELLKRMPSHSVDIYAGWEDLKFRVNIYPNGGEMGGSTEEPNNYANWYNILYGEKVTEYKDITRDYIKATGSGSYAYVVDPYGQDVDGEGKKYARSAIYTETPENGEPLEYVQAPGAYVLLGWFEAKEFNSDGTPKKDAYGQYITKDRPFSFGSAPNRDVTLIAKWQRAGGFYVRYNIEDPALQGVNYGSLQIPVDENEYIDGANALVLPAIDAPHGYSLDYWVDKMGNHYEPNQLLPIKDVLADQVGGALQLWLTAHYRPYVPSDRVMADYTFMTNVEGTQTTVHNDVTGQDETVTSAPYNFAANYHAHEIQRIAVNEELKPPVTPAAPDGYVFKGWYYDKEGTRRFDGFGVIAAPAYTTIYAVFDRVYRVNYYLTDALTNTKTDIVLSTQTYNRNGTEKLDTRHVFHPVDSDHYVLDWTDGTAAYAYNRLTNKLVTGDMDLYAEIKVRKYIQFNSMGGSYVEAQMIPEVGWPVYPLEPARKGYDFLGWFTEPEGGSKYEFDKPLPVDSANNPISTLYAHWKANHSERGKLIIAWWAQTADRPEDDDAGYANDPDYDINTDTSHYQLIAMRQDFTAPIDVYTLDKYDTPQANEGLGLMSGWNDIVTVLNWAKDRGITSATNFITNTVGEGGSVADVAKYYEFNSNYAASVASSVTVDDSGNSILNIRFVLKLYTFRYNLTNNNNVKVEVYAKNGNYNDTYSFKTWLGKDISLWWPIDNTVRRAAGDSASSGAWVKKTNTGNYSFNGWKEVNGSKNNWGTLQPTADKEKIDNAYANGGIYLLSILDTNYSGAGKLHYMEWNGEKYIEMTALTEDKKISTNTANYHASSSSCGMDYYDLMLAKTITNYVNVNDKNGEPKRMVNGVNTLIDHNYVASGDTRAYSRYKTRSATQVYELYESVYTNEFNMYYKDYTFYGGLTVTYPFWDLLRQFPEYTPSYPVNPMTDVEFIHDENLLNEYATDGTSLKDYSRTENNLKVISEGTELNGRQIHYQDDSGKWNTMDWSAFVSTVYPSMEKTHKYERTDVGTAGYDLYFYYEPVDFTLTLIDRSREVTSMTVKYKAQLTGSNGAMKDYLPEVYSPATDQYPAPVGKEFVGWGVIDGLSDADQVYSTRDGRMPAYNVTLYAIWAPIYCGVKTEGVDKNGNANGSPVSALYTVKYGTRLKETKVPVTPAKDGEIFLGWQIKDDNGELRDISMNYIVRESVTLYPKWMNLSTKRIIFHANGGKTDGVLKDEDKYVVDSNRYAVGTKATILDGADADASGKRLVLYVDRVDVNNHPYRGEFAYWNTKADGSGQSYYANTVYIFQEGDKDVNGNPLVELHLYAIYGEYRETTLYYDKNADNARFVLQSDRTTSYANKVINKVGDPHNGEVSVLYRDWMNSDWSGSFQKKPNDPFPVAEDEDGINFTAVRSDSYGNMITLAGWADFATATLPIARDGDTAYVNTIDAENTNTLYAVWAICKVVDQDGEEHVFDTIQKAVDFINNNGNVSGRQLGKIVNKTDTVEMLIDYNTPENVSIPVGCNVTLTTAHSGKYYYNDTRNATITRAVTGGSMFTNSGTFTTTDIILDGGNTQTAAKTCTGNGGVIMGSAGSLTVGDDTVVRNSKAVNGGGVYASAGNLNIGDACFYDCEATTNGGAIYAASGVTAEENGMIIDGHTTLTLGTDDEANKIQAAGASTNAANGGGIYVASDAGFTFTGGELIKCKVTGSGGGLYNAGTVIMAEKVGVTTLTRGSLEYCSAQNGGAVYNAEGGKIDMTGGYIEHCMAIENGGGIFTESTETQTIGTGSNTEIKGAVNLHTAAQQPGIISDCTAANGGGIYLAAGELDMTGGTVRNCTARKRDGDTVDSGSGMAPSGNGGAIYNLGTLKLGQLAATGNLAENIVSCMADVNGGGIYNGRYGSGSNTVTGELDITGGQIIDCVAKENGGAIYEITSSAIVFKGLTINGHVNLPSTTPNAKRGGGIYMRNRTEDERAYAASLKIEDGCCFYNLTVTEEGGAIYNRARAWDSIAWTTYTISNSTIDGHYNGFASSQMNAKRGGAIFMQNGTTTMDNAIIRNCNVSGDGGAIYNNNDAYYPSDKSIGSTIKMSDTMIEYCTAEINGGGVFMKMGALSLNGCDIRSCAAQCGSGIYARTNDGGKNYSKVTMKDGTVTGCITSKAAGGAINIRSAKTIVDGSPMVAASDANALSSIYFGGNAVVYDNLDNRGNQKNLVLEQDPDNDGNNAVIRTVPGGLGFDAHIGVYVIGDDTGGSETNPYKEHGMSGMPFGTRDGSDNGTYLFRFTNDRNGAYAVKKASDNYIYWLDMICKLTDKNDNLLYAYVGNTVDGYTYLPAVYTSLGDGVSAAEGDLYKVNGTEYAKADAMSPSNEIKLKMLRDYAVPDADRAVLSDPDDNIVFTTAETGVTTAMTGNHDLFRFIYSGAFVGREAGDSVGKAIIKRGQDGGSLLTVNNSAAKLTMTGIIFDGGAVFTDRDADPDVEDFAISGVRSTTSGGLINVTSGSLTVGNGTTMRNTNANGDAANPDINGGLRGGAVYVAAEANLELGGVPSNPVIFERCISEAGGGAVYTAQNTLTVNGTAAVGSGGTSKIYGICFIHCFAGDGGAINAYSSNLDSSTGTGLTINNCSFTKCRAYRDGGAVSSTASNTVIDGCEFISCFVDNNALARYGGAAAFMNTGEGAAASVKGSTFSNCANEYGEGKGGTIYIGGKTTLSMTESANTIAGGRAKIGGAFYIHEGSTLVLTDNSTIKGNTATEAGAGIYLKTDAVLKLAGAPDFGGKGTDTAGNLIIETTDASGAAVAAGNYVRFSDYAGKQNGQKNYHSSNNVRQDIYISEAHENAPQTIVLTGDLTGEPGTIWVWAENEVHYKQTMPFAMLEGVEFADAQNGSLQEGELDAVHLEVFRNARDDEKTDNATDTWLKGTIEGDNKGYVYWTGISGIRKVILRKLNSLYVPLKDKTFTIYKGTSASAYVPKGGTGPLTGLASGESGCFFVGILPYGWYIIEETEPSRFFYVVVDGSGVYGTKEADASGTMRDKVDGYDTRQAAETQAKARYDAIRKAHP